MPKVEIYDTTLRDGEQKEGLKFSVQDKLEIVSRLDNFGISYIEGGWPGSNPSDINFFQRAQKHLSLKNAKLVAFGATRKKNITIEKDSSITAILDSGVSTVAIFGKSSEWQVVNCLETSLDENLRMIDDTISFFTKQNIDVIYDAEHFFDGYKNNPMYTLKTLETALNAGASCFVLCDTNGGMLPSQIEDVLNSFCHSKPNMGIHCHNDSECAVANTLKAVECGVIHVQGTLNGYGERCGNANLCSVVPNLILKKGIDCGISRRKLKEIKSVADFISEKANFTPDPSQPYIGDAAFAHKGGVHANGFGKNPKAYAHIDPEEVGNKQRTVVSRLAGKSTIIDKAKVMGLDLRQAQVSKILRAIKNQEHQEYHYEAAEGSLEILILKEADKFQPLFKFEDYDIRKRIGIIDKKEGKEAVVKIHINGERIIEDGYGDGYVNALDKALRKALLRAYPDLDHFELTDYKVRIIDDKEFTGTASKVRVLVGITDRKKGRTFNTIGVSTDIIDASWEAIVEGYTRAMVPYLINK